MNIEDEQHHRRSVRLKKYNYCQSGMYFVTICTKTKKCLFGKIENEKVRLNRFGDIALACWLEIPVHFPHVVSDEYIVMPNHIHGILFIDDPRHPDEIRGMACHAPTQRKFGLPVAGSLPTIILSYKSAVTKSINEIRGIKGASVWQRNYYEHIIRTEEELYKTRSYIVGNPAMWAKDTLKEDIHNILD